MAAKVAEYADFLLALAMTNRFVQLNLRRLSCFLLTLVVYSSVAQAQNSFPFVDGLVLRAGVNYGREALYIDPVAHAIYTKSMVTPVDGGTFGTDAAGQEMKWTRLSADAGNRSRMWGGANNYVYFSYESPKAQAAILNIAGNSGVFVNGEPHMGDPYASGWMNIPVKLRQGRNDFFVRGQRIKGGLTFPEKALFLDVRDATVPQIVLGKDASHLKAAIVVINTTGAVLKDLEVSSSMSGKTKRSKLPVVPAYSTRKAFFEFDGSGVQDKGLNDCSLTLQQKGLTLDQQVLQIESVSNGEKYSETFVSSIDGSLQYYAVAPKTGVQEHGSALFFSVHGAGVEAIGQARAYQSKDWGNLVAPTNRRPRGFNWEDWGRLDALEVLALAKKEFKPDPQRVYLTGHSMGGHGTWFLGATYPDKWAAIAPCAGYPTLKSYGSADGIIPDSSSSVMGRLLLRASNQSDVPKLATNYKQLGVYVLHGDADRTVSVNYARQMR